MVSRPLQAVFPAHTSAYRRVTPKRLRHEAHLLTGEYGWVTVTPPGSRSAQTPTYMGRDPTQGRLYCRSVSEEGESCSLLPSAGRRYLGSS